MKLKILIFFGILTLFFLNVYSQTLQSNIQEGIKYRESGEYEKSIELLKKVRKTSDENPEVLYQLALSHMKFDDIHHRKIAELLLKEALRKDRDNVRYRLEYARLKIKVGAFGEARTILEEIIERKPDYSDAYLELSRMEYGYVIRFLRQKFSVYSKIKNSEIEYIEYAVAKLYRIENILKKGITYNPDDFRLYFELGKIYLEMRKYKESIDILSEVTETYPEYVNGHLLLGLAYYKKRNYRNSDKEFKLAKKYMPENTKKIYESFDAVFRQTVPGNDQNYWEKYNPFYLSGLNLRELEHFSRTAYADLILNDENSGLPGWKTGQGKAFIRYGVPCNVYTSIPEIEGSLEYIYGYPYELEKQIIANLVWTYKYEDFYFTFLFNREHDSNRYYFCDYSAGFYEDIVQEIPEIYKHPFDSVIISPECCFAAFRAEKNTVDIDFYYSIPGFKIRKKRDSYLTSNGIFIFDEEWNIKEKKIRRFYIHNAGKNENISFLNSINIKPGKYNLTYECFETDTAFFVQEKLDIEVFPVGDSLAVSDVVLGVQKHDEIILSERLAPFNFVPRPSLKFLEDKISIYFEIYNLAQINRRADYQITIEINSEKDETKGVPSLTYKYLKVPAKTVHISKTYGYSVYADEEKQAIELDISKLKHGKYVLRLRVLDKNSKTDAEGWREFELK